MLRESFRPWGQLEWVLKRLPRSDWSLVGALATEARCLAAWWELRARSQLSYYSLFEIEYEPSYRREEAEALLFRRRRVYQALGGQKSRILRFGLIERVENIVNAVL